MPTKKEPAKKAAVKKKRGPAKGSGGRHRIPIDYHKLDQMCVIQCTGEECASLLGISYDTLESAIKRDHKKTFPEYFAEKSANGKASLRRRQYKAAVEDGNTTMMIWLGKQWLGQAEKVENKSELSGADGGAIELITKIELVAGDNS